MTLYCTCSLHGICTLALGLLPDSRDINHETMLSCMTCAWKFYTLLAAKSNAPSLIVRGGAEQKKLSGRGTA